MKKVLSALLVCASVMAAAPASAADYLTVYFSGSGSAYTVTGTDPTKGTFTSGPAQLTFIIPLDDARGATVGGKLKPSFSFTDLFGGPGGRSTFTSSDTSLSFNQQFSTGRYQQSSSGSACGDFSSGFTLGTIAVDSSCSTFSYSSSSFSPFGDGTSLSFSGRLETIIVTEGFGSPANVGLVNAATPTPEPATWSMMLVGFGVAAGVLRRQKRRSAVA